MAVGHYTVQESAWKSDGEIKVMTAEELSTKIKCPTLVCGEMDDSLRQMLARKRKNVMIVSPAQSLRRPSYLAEIAWQRWQMNQVDDVISLSPIYLHMGEGLPS